MQENAAAREPPRATTGCKHKLKFEGRRESRDVTFEPILCVELLIVTKIENDRSVHQHRVVNDMGAYTKNAALEWTKLGS